MSRTLLNGVVEFAGRRPFPWGTNGLVPEKASDGDVSARRPRKKWFGYTFSGRDVDDNALDVSMAAMLR
jgi:hypothetical protein